VEELGISMATLHRWKGSALTDYGLRPRGSERPFEIEQARRLLETRDSASRQKARLALGD
jgi:hypothetical protein